MKKKILLLPFLLLSLAACEKKVTVDLKPVDNLKIIQDESEKYDNIFLDDRIEGQWYNYGLGDPFIYRFNGYFYLLCSTRGTENGVLGWKSLDLMNWEQVNNGILPKGYVVSPTIPESFDSWASEVIYLDGTFYLVESNNGKGHYVYSSSSPEGPFELISEQIDDYIDGSFFLDTNGKVVLLTASAGNITGKYMDEDMKGTSSSTQVPNTSMNGWTEGPEYLVKDGVRYYFYTGNGVTQRAYRIDYSYSPIVEGKNYLESPITQAHNILLNTDDDFYGLGHGTVFMGPDLDSYYIAYHNMNNKGNYEERRFNLSRMLFNGTEISMQHIGAKDNIVPSLADYQCLNNEELENKGDKLLSKEITEDSFTVEYNFTGNGKLIFSYVDNQNYGYAKFDGRNIDIVKVENGSEDVKATVKTYRDYNLNVMHSIRLGYKDGLMDVSFDNLEIANDIEVNEFSGGLVGYESKFKEKGALTFNNTAQGDSDKQTEKTNLIPSNSYDIEKSKLSSNSGLRLTENNAREKMVTGSYELSIATPGDYVTYLDYVLEDGSYGLDMVLHSKYYGKEIGIQIDGGNINKYTIPTYQEYEGYVRAKIADLKLTKGNHNITIFGLNDEVSYQMMYLERNYNVANTTYEHDLLTYPEKGINYPTFFNKDKDGFYSENTARYLVTFGDTGFEDVEISVDMKITGENGTGTAGLVIAADNWAFNNVNLDNSNSIQGYYFAVNNNRAQIIESNYQYSDESCRKIVKINNDETFNLKAVKQGKTLTLYINNEKILETFVPLGENRGACGIYANYMEARFNNLKIKVL